MISGSSDRKHERSTQARVMRIIAIIIIIAVDVGKAGELVTQLSWPCSWQLDRNIFIVSFLTWAGRKWACREQGAVL